MADEKPRQIPWDEVPMWIKREAFKKGNGAVAQAVTWVRRDQYHHSALKDGLVISAFDRNTKLRQVCAQCGETSLTQVRPKDLRDWEAGRGLLQDLFPYLTAAERELFFQSGLCGECWKKVMSPARDEFTPAERVQWTDLPSEIKAQASDDLQKFRGAQWFSFVDEPDIFHAFHGGKWIGQFDLPSAEGA